MARSRMESFDIMDSLLQHGAPASCWLAARARCRRYKTVHALLAEIVDQVVDPARVAPLIVVPRNHFDQVSADHESHRRIDDGGARVAAEISRDQLVLFVSQVPLQGS